MRIWVAALIVLLACAPVRASEPTLTADTDVVVGDDVRVRLIVTNVGDQPVRDVAPELRYRLVERTPAPAPMIQQGEQYVWEASFARPPTAGQDPVIAIVRYRNAFGRQSSLPHVSVVTTGEAPSPDVVLTLTQPDTGSFPRVVATLSNGGTDVLRGRLVALLPDGYFTEPTSQAVEILPGRNLSVPLAVQRLGGRVVGRVPVGAILQLEVAGTRQAMASSTTLIVSTDTDPRTATPLWVGFVAMLVAFGLLGVALRVSARRRATTSSP